jgi:hypothetical protein
MFICFVFAGPDTGINLSYAGRQTKDRLLFTNYTKTLV